MKIAIVGASGKAGQLIAKEAIKRGHDVTAIVRDKSKLTGFNVSVLEKNVFDLTRDDLNGYDVVINAFGAPLGEEDAHVKAGEVLIEALRGTNTRLIIVGGAGSLYVNPEETILLVDTPEFPDVVVPTAKGQGRNLESLKTTEDLNWTFLSPSAMFDPDGARTGKYELGLNQLLVNSTGESYISYADYASALLDEVDNKKYVKQRFTVVGEKE